MPQLDILLWFSQIFWVTFFFIIFFSYIRILHIPLSYLIIGTTSLKKVNHHKMGFLFNLHHYLNLKKFWSAYNTRKII